jgi:hypothetical protein
MFVEAVDSLFGGVNAVPIASSLGTMVETDIILENNVFHFNERFLPQCETIVSLK